MRWWMIAMMGLALLTWSDLALACESDNDCKGERVCVDGQCVMPETAQELEALKVEKAKAEAKAGAVPEVAPPPEPVPPPPPAPQAFEAVSATTPAQTELPRRGMPAVLAPNEAGLVVRINKSIPGLVVYIDDQPMGEAPFEFVVSPGEHRVRATGGGYWTRETETNIWPGKSRLVELRVSPDGPFGIRKHSLFLPVRYQLNWALINGQWFTGFPALSTIPGLGFGWIVADQKAAFWELAIAAFGPPSGVVSFSARYQRRLAGPVLFGGLELDVSGLYPNLTNQYDSMDNWTNTDANLRFGGFVAVRAGLSLFLGSGFEMRFDPLGVMVGVASFDYTRGSYDSFTGNYDEVSTTLAGLILAWNPAINLALRL